MSSLQQIEGKHPHLLTLLGGVKYLTIKMSTILDQQIAKDPKNIKTNLQTALRESYEGEALHNELRGIVENHSD